MANRHSKKSIQYIDQCFLTGGGGDFLSGEKFGYSMGVGEKLQKSYFYENIKYIEIKIF